MKPQRGTSDGIFVLKQALARRKEFGQETWALLLDLVKAFDRANREMLWILCSIFGAPDLIVRHIRALYEGSVLKCAIDGVKATIPSTTGVKQGDNLSKISKLFNVSIKTIKQDNENLDIRRPGQILKITIKAF